ncbi:hypothetical protein PENANT_c021G09868 [Penicillium antarcticum]|uniref:FAD-binding FR-type domain-containing protein n=1 Tax=Penicillium antarcticum TaxID=416450 RepID=A0A1V6PZM5_9EURO|nr:uncharacterized protein N7508_010845 [Penicillium antarcticum]KAJ5296024.1 hypothetical protein N7508_010845 [Penicillium antarcticum]OQD82504.1 hypothetical protein PENANT_c021G09868 [Penicillium antarcticum]
MWSGESNYQYSNDHCFKHPYYNLFLQRLTPDSPESNLVASYLMKPFRLCSSIPRLPITSTHIARTNQLRSISNTNRQMSSEREDSIPHELRTAAEPRQNRLHTVRLSHIEQVNPSVRLLQFALPTQENNNNAQQSFNFLPGQWLDVHIPSIAKAGGFTITSTPADAQVLPSPEASTAPAEEPLASSINFQGRPPYVELAVQDSPGNPAAAWLWRPKEDILGKELSIRVGGSFTWPPTGVDSKDVKNGVFIAGGVGINPLISIISHLNNNDPNTICPSKIHILYSTRLPKGHENLSLEEKLEQILFLPRLRQIMKSQIQSRRTEIHLDLFLTDLTAVSDQFGLEEAGLSVHTGRITETYLHEVAVGASERNDLRDTVCYVCGPPAMTDAMVDVLGRMLGEGGKKRIFFEKWW